jgi:hypothetical protein
MPKTLVYKRVHPQVSEGYTAPAPFTDRIPAGTVITTVYCDPFRSNHGGINKKELNIPIKKYILALCILV